ncbi:MAG: MucR family transcriptional regulator [Patescibacteria group bacterium]|nr:MucR family transcriptional regulator [Patescibacteria group bacterium]
MNPEKGTINKEKVNNRPERVVCLVCGREFNLLHWSHLSTHGFRYQGEYRVAYELDDSVPLNSQKYAEVRRRIQERPDKQQLSSSMGKDWQLRRRVALILLERENFYTPGRTSDITQIPLQTIYSAIRRGALPSLQRELLVETDQGVAVRCDKVVRGIKLEDMLEFAKHHRPKIILKK